MSKNLKNKIAEGGTTVLAVIIILTLAYGASWSGVLQPAFG